jgi:hypothetical protein
MKNETCTWAINNFPRGLKDKYISYLKANNVTIRDHLEYLIAKTLRDAGFDVPRFVLLDLIKRMDIRKRKQK